MKVRRYYLIAILLLSINFIGCSLIGLGVGIYASADEELFNQESSKFPAIELNVTILILTTSNETISGNFLGISRIPFSEYNVKYNEAIKHIRESVYLPKLGEEITFTQIIEKKSWQQPKEYLLKKCRMKFYGFGLNSILLSDSNYESSVAVMLSTINNLSTLYADKIELKKIGTLIDKGEIPLVAILNIGHNNKHHSVPVIDIKEIKIESFGGWWFYGLLAGVVIDAVILSGEPQIGK